MSCFSRSIHTCYYTLRPAIISNYYMLLGGNKGKNCSSILSWSCQVRVTYRHSAFSAHFKSLEEVRQRFLLVHCVATMPPELERCIDDLEKVSSSLVCAISGKISFLYRNTCHIPVVLYAVESRNCCERRYMQ